MCFLHMPQWLLKWIKYLVFKGNLFGFSAISFLHEIILALSEQQNQSLWCHHSLALVFSGVRKKLKRQLLLYVDFFQVVERSCEKRGWILK